MRLEDAPEEAKGTPQARSASQSKSPGGLYSPQHISRKLEEIKASAQELPKPPKPRFTPAEPSLDVPSALRRIQIFISSLEYNFTGINHFERRRDRGMMYLSAVADCIMRDCLPIQCVEAVFLAAVLTAGLQGVDRYPLSFKSQVDGKIFRHIVLAVQYQGKWGALGLSRRPNLMDKELVYKSLADLVWEYERAYQTCWHRLCGVYVGFPFPEDRRSILPIKWRALHLNFEAHQGLPCPQTSLVLDNYAKSAHWLVDYNYKVGCLPEGLPELLQRPDEYPRRLHALVKRGLRTPPTLPTNFLPTPRLPKAEPSNNHDKKRRRRKTLTKGKQEAEESAKAEGATSEDTRPPPALPPTPPSAVGSLSATLTLEPDDQSQQTMSPPKAFMRILTALAQANGREQALASPAKSAPTSAPSALPVPPTATVVLLPEHNAAFSLSAV